MKNPFIHIDEKDGQYLAENCSLNRLVLAKLPVQGIEDSLQGKTADQVFSTPVLIREMEENACRLEVDLANTPQRQLPLVLEQRLTDSRKEIAAAADALVKKFGYRLGMIFLTLKKGEEENRRARPDWNDAHWEYWAGLETVILVGGLANGLLGRRLKHYAYALFKTAQVKPYNFVLFDNASVVGIMGCASLIQKPEGISTVFDFGQTNIKRSIVKKSNGDFIGITTLPSFESKYMSCDAHDPQERMQQAKCLHKYLLKIILNTYREAQQYGEVGDEIIISIASYTVGGRLNDRRGGYAKLSALCQNYAECLSEELSGRLKHKVRVTLVHDGTAVALYFADYKDAVCITMGTGFGVGFPDIHIR